MKIRVIDPGSDFEINLVAQRMQQTLVEVLGPEKGETMYSLDWLIERVRWHLDLQKTNGKVLILEDQSKAIIGHAIARIDYNSPGGLFSTVFIEKSCRRIGGASKLINHVEAWFTKNRVTKIVYNTAENHTPILKLFMSRGYAITHTENGMVQLTKVLTKNLKSEEPVPVDQ